MGEMIARRTDLVQLNDVGLCALLAEEGLCGLAVGAVRLGEDSCNVAMVSVIVEAKRPSVEVSTHQRSCCR